MNEEEGLLNIPWEVILKMIGGKPKRVVWDGDEDWLMTNINDGADPETYPYGICFEFMHGSKRLVEVKVDELTLTPRDFGVKSLHLCSQNGE